MSTPRANSAEQSFENKKIIEEKNYKTNEIKRYTKGKFLGKGGFAKCYEFTICDTKQIVAAKVIPKSTLTKTRAKQKLMSEIKIHRSLHHQSIVAFQHCFEDSENVYILLEMCSNQTLNELLRRRKRLTEIEVQCYLVQLLSSLTYLVKAKVIHRDLKLGNLFLSDKMELKLGDFGLATKLEFDGERKRTICGTPNYIAPEVLEGKKGHSFEVDIWSFGVIMYTLLIGKPPFETSDVKTTYKRIKMNMYQYPEHTTISAHAKDLITKILVADPMKRPTIDQILAHDFFNQGNSIPKLLPVSTLACPPSASYLRQFYLNSNIKESGSTIEKSNSPKRLENTLPSQLNKLSFKDRKDFLNTDRPGSQPINSCENSNNNNNFNANNAKLENNLEEKLTTGTAGNSRILEKQSQLQSHGVDMESKKSVQTLSPLHNQIGSENILSTRNSLDKIHIVKQKSISEKQNLPTAPATATISDVWIRKWVDYSSKYGLGYLLSNGCTGAFFNDSTKIILNQAGDKFQYIEKKPGEKEDNIQIFTLTEYPKDIQKKVTLIQHFKSYLEGELKENDVNQHHQELLKGFDGTNRQFFYVKKWLRTKHAIMFRLSNQLVQVIFQDQTEILISSELQLVVYVNKQKERLSFPLAAALDSNNKEMVKRLKYTKEILSHMINGVDGQRYINDENKGQKQPDFTKTTTVLQTQPTQPDNRQNKYSPIGNTEGNQEKHQQGNTLSLNSRISPSQVTRHQYTSSMSKLSNPLQKTDQLILQETNLNTIIQQSSKQKMINSPSLQQHNKNSNSISNNPSFTKKDQIGQNLAITSQIDRHALLKSQSIVNGKTAFQLGNQIAAQILTENMVLSHQKQIAF